MFQRRFTMVLYDIADEALSFEDIHGRVEGFFDQQDQAAGATWNSLREEVRAGRVAVDGLKQVHDEFPPEIRIDPFELDPCANTLEEESGFAEAA